MRYPLVVLTVVLGSSGLACSSDGGDTPSSTGGAGGASGGASGAASGGTGTTGGSSTGGTSGGSSAGGASGSTASGGTTAAGGSSGNGSGGAAGSSGGASGTAGDGGANGCNPNCHGTLNTNNCEPGQVLWGCGPIGDFAEGWELECTALFTPQPTYCCSATFLSECL
jgi:hypothetical protein